MKILLADPETNILYGLKTYFEALPEFSITGEVESIADLFLALNTNSPDLILLSSIFLEKNHENFVQKLKQLYPEIKILGMYTNPDIKQYACSIGVDGFINKADKPENMINIIKKTV